MTSLHFTARLASQQAGAPVRWDVDLDAPEDVAGAPAGWVDPDSWSLEHQGQALPFCVDSDTLDSRRFTIRFRAPSRGDLDVTASATLRKGPRPAPGKPPARTVPLVGAGESLSLGATDAVGDLHVGLQTVVDAVDWYGRGRLDLLLSCLGHEGGAFVYAAAREDDGAGYPVFRRAGRLSGFGDGPAAYSGKVRAIDFRGDCRFDLLECRGSHIFWRRNFGEVGDPNFSPPEPLEAGGEVFDVGARSQMVCPVDLGDGLVSLIVGTNDWTDYWPKDVGAWEDKPGYLPYDEQGVWRGGPMYGRLYLLRNTGSREAPAFASPVALCHEDGTPLEVYGLAGPTAFPAATDGAAFDLVVSDFLDRLWYFRNTGRPGADGAPRFAPRTPVRTTGEPVPEIDRTPVVPPPPADYPPGERLRDELVLPTCMHAVTLVQWPAAQGGETDLLVAAEDGFVRALRLAGRTPDGVPIVGPPRRLQEYGARLSVGAKACPNVVDWDGDGREDLVIGNAAGQVLLCRNTGTAGEPVFAAPEPFYAGDRPLWLMAGPPGTMQGPSEVKWGYINPAVGPWTASSDASGSTAARAIVCGDSLGHNTLYLDGGQSSGEAAAPDARIASPSSPGALGSTHLTGRTVSPGRRLHVLRDGLWQPLVTRWRCRPQLVDWGDGEVTYLQIDATGLVMRYRILADGPGAEQGEAHVQPLEPLCYADGAPVRLDSDFGGRIGRLKLAVADWDGDGLPDLLMAGSATQPVDANPFKKSTVFLLRNTGSPGRPVLARPEPILLDAGQPALFGGHSCVPAPCHLPDQASGPQADGVLLDILVGSENGRVYAFRRSYIEGTASAAGAASVTSVSAR